MISQENICHINECIPRHVHFLSVLLNNMWKRCFESKRLAPMIKALLHCGISPKTGFIQEAAEWIFSFSKEDGGLIDVQDSCAAIYIARALGWDTMASQLTNWLCDCQDKDTGGWGRHPRDISRIPTTALSLVTLLDYGVDAEELFVQNGLNFLLKTWEKDLAEAGLSYKGAYVLSTISRINNREGMSQLIENTVNFLIACQNEVGGILVQPRHPDAASIIWTATALDGLFRMRNDILPSISITMNQTVTYILSQAMPSGGWPEHEIDFVTSVTLETLAHIVNASKLESTSGVEKITADFVK